MTDRELLEMAAKAAGYEYEWEWPRGAKRPLFMRIKDGDRMPVWQPMSDAGDALRLACDVPLLAINPRDGTRATCRAIVSAAAEIGRAMP